jgi:hypothetical protein
MSSLTDQVLDQLDSTHIQAIATRLGIDPSEAEAAIRQAVPVMVGKLAHNASTDAGADAVHAAAQDHAGLDIGSVIGSVLAGGGGGGSILGHIFGGREDQAAQNMGQASGIGGANMAQLMAMLAPIIMSVLGNLTQRQNVDAGGLGGLLGQELERVSQSAHGGLLGSLLDQDGDGKLGMGDLLKVGSEFFARRGRV